MKEIDHYLNKILLGDNLEILQLDKCFQTQENRTIKT